MATRTEDLTNEEISTAYFAANEQGFGFPAGGDDMNPEQAADAECLLNIRDFRDARLTKFAVGENAKGHMIAICDINGPWGQDITAWIEAQERKGDA